MTYKLISFFINPSPPQSIPRLTIMTFFFATSILMLQDNCNATVIQAEDLIAQSEYVFLADQMSSLFFRSYSAFAAVSS